jgi:hypothetical protein
MLPEKAMTTPRCMTRSEAAAYCGLTPAAFSRWVRDGILPTPVKGTHRWDRKALDRALDKASGISAPSTETSAYDEWRAKRRARQS